MFFFFKQKTAYEMRISDWSSDVCSSDLEQHGDGAAEHRQRQQQQESCDQYRPYEQRHLVQRHARRAHVEDCGDEVDGAENRGRAGQVHRENHHVDRHARSEEHTSELQSLMRISYAVFCLKKKKQQTTIHTKSKQKRQNTPK